jgi:glycosyltransferase involved in cell wall biosynthesis
MPTDPIERAIPRGLSVIIPAYNEEVSLEAFLQEVVEHCKTRGYELIVVNDGSRDRTPAILEAAAARGELRVLHHKVNRGYGAAIKTGVQAAGADLAITIDADGQHVLEDIDRLYQICLAEDADMINGSRRGQGSDGAYRQIGKSAIRSFARLLMPLHIHDINSGMKIYRTDLARRYLPLCPDSMPYSDIITLTFVHNRHRVLEEPIRIRKRLGGVSTINTHTAFQTIMEIVHVLVLFNPMRIFLPMSALCLVAGFAWGLPIVAAGRGVSIGAMLAIVTGLIFFFLGLIAEQLSWIRKAPTELQGADRVNQFCGRPPQGAGANVPQAPSRADDPATQTAGAQRLP